MQIAEIDLGKYSNRFSSYTELRLHENRSQSIVLLNGDVVSNARDTTGGVSARVFNGGTWGFSSNPDMSNDAIDGTITAATRNADFWPDGAAMKTQPCLFLMLARIVTFLRRKR